MPYMWERDGSGVYVLGAQAAGWSHTGDLVETIVASVPVPANILTPGSQLDVRFIMSCTNNANSKTMRVRYSSLNNSPSDGNSYMSLSMANNATDMGYVRIAARAASSEVAFNNGTGSGLGQLSGANQTATVGTAAVSYVNFTVTLTNAADTGTLEAYVVRLIPAK